MEHAIEGNSISWPHSFYCIKRVNGTLGFDGQENDFFSYCIFVPFSKLSWETVGPCDRIYSFFCCLLSGLIKVSVSWSKRKLSISTDFCYPYLWSCFELSFFLVLFMFMFLCQPLSFSLSLRARFWCHFFWCLKDDGYHEASGMSINFKIKSFLQSAKGETGLFERSNCEIEDSWTLTFLIW